MPRYDLLAVTLLVALGVVAPALGVTERDSFPLSTYPMFSRKRERVRVDQALGVKRTGQAVALPPWIVARTDEVMLANATIRRAVRSGRRPLKRFCRRIAKRVAADESLAGVVRIEIASVSYDPIRYFTDGPAPLQKRTRQRCRVARR